MALRCLIGLNLSWVGPLIPVIARAQTASLAEAGFLVSSYYLGAIPPMVTGRWFLAKFGMRGCLTMASALMALGLATVALGTGMPMLWSGSLIFGTGAGLAVISGSVYALSCGRDNPASLLNKLAMFYGVGALSGPLVAWAGTNTAWSYHAVYAFGTIYAVCAGFFLWRSAEQAVAEDPEKDRFSGERQAHKYADVWMCSLLLLLYIGVEIGATAWLYTYLTRAGGHGDGAGALGVSFLCVGLTFGRFVGIHLCRRFSLDRITSIFMLIATGSLTALSIFPKMGLVALAVSALCGMGFGPVYPNILAAVNARHPDEVDRVTPIVVSVSFVGGIFMPFLIALVFEHVGLQEGMGLVALTSALVFVFYLFVRARYLRKTA